ncbi:uncharacterized protein LOC144742367 [Ciona intestinalis]
MKVSVALIALLFGCAYAQVAYVDTWPANDQTPAGARGVVGYNEIGNGTCTLKFPDAVYWFHMFDGDIVPSKSSVSEGLYAITAPNKDWQDTGNFSFVVNFFFETFNASQIVWSCDVSDSSPLSVESFPNNMEQNYTRARITDLNMTDQTKIILTLPDSVDNFGVDAPAVVEAVNGNAYTIGNFGVQKEFRFEFNYLTRWFSASEITLSSVEGAEEEEEETSRKRRNAHF